MANFIAGAIKHPGALTKSAHAAGESPMEFAQEHKHSSGKTGARARFALLLKSFHRKTGKTPAQHNAVVSHNDRPPGMGTV